MTPLECFMNASGYIERTRHWEQSKASWLLLSCEYDAHLSGQMLAGVQSAAIGWASRVSDSQTPRRMQQTEGRV